MINKASNLTRWILLLPGALIAGALTYLLGYIITTYGLSTENKSLIVGIAPYIAMGGASYNFIMVAVFIAHTYKSRIAMTTLIFGILLVGVFVGVNIIMQGYKYLWADLTIIIGIVIGYYHSLSEKNERYFNNQ